MPDPELKPCPFCGSEPHIDPPSQYAPEITCPRCNVLMGNPSRKKLIETWNQRIKQAPGVIPEAFKDER
jgi:Lar family restriction alleviation protein